MVYMYIYICPVAAFSVFWNTFVRLDLAFQVLTWISDMSEKARGSSHAQKKQIYEKLVAGWTNPIEKYGSKWESSPNRGEIKQKILKTTTQTNMNYCQLPSVTCSIYAFMSFFSLEKGSGFAFVLSSLYQTDPHHHTRDKKPFPITVGRR